MSTAAHIAGKSQPKKTNATTKEQNSGCDEHERKCHRQNLRRLNPHDKGKPRPRRDQPADIFWRSNTADPTLSEICR
jgi:hypothetical protein